MVIYWHIGEGQTRFSAIEPVVLTYTYKYECKTFVQQRHARTNRQENKQSQFHPGNEPRKPKKNKKLVRGREKGKGKGKGKSYSIFKKRVNLIFRDCLSLSLSLIYIEFIEKKNNK